MKPIKVRISLMIGFLLCLLITSAVYAGTTSTNGGVGDAWCTASKTINQGPSGWDAYVKSQCDLGIGVIGRMWWTVRQYCPITGTYPTNKQYGGEVNYNTNYYQRVTYSAYQSCGSGGMVLQDLGRHDFQTVLNTWQPTVNHYEDR